MLLRTLLETEGNSDHVNEFTLFAISDVMLAHPEWPESGLRWLEVFDRIDLGDIRDQAKRNRAAVPQRHGIAAALQRELFNAFDPTNHQPICRTEDAAMPIENDLIYGTRAIAAFLEIPIQRCRELIAAGNLPTFQMPGATTRCARRSTVNAHWRALEEAARAA